MSIRFYFDEVNERLEKPGNVKRLIEKVIRNEDRIPGDLSFVFTGDKYLVEINNEFLKRDYLTDVIAFDYSKGNELNGEIYISIETVKRNSINYGVSLKEEIVRVMIHGVLHMCGYDDKTKGEKERMTEMENNWLEKLKSN